MSNLEKYNKVFCDTLQISEDQLNGLEYQGVELWDSVGHMTLMAELEDAFDIMMETDDNAAPDGALFAPVNASLERLAALAAERGVPIGRTKFTAPLYRQEDLAALEQGLFALGGEAYPAEPEQIARKPKDRCLPVLTVRRSDQK